MGRFQMLVFQAAPLGLMVVLCLACSPSARGQSGGVRPFGRVYGGLGYGAQWGYNGYGNDYDSPRTYANRYNDSHTPIPGTVFLNLAPFQTEQHYEPGDGYRYPLYYNPGTRTYFYYPVPR